MRALVYAGFLLAPLIIAKLMLSYTVARLPMPKQPSLAFIMPYIYPKLVGDASSSSTFFVFAFEAATLGPCAL
jgi:hypothetical protein